MKKIFLLLPALLLSWLTVYPQDDNVDNTTKHDPAEYLSNTMPVLYINTDGEQPIIDKENYIGGCFYIDANGIGGYESIGTEDNPLSLHIKGRGNSTWEYPKKPYHLKLDAKTSLLGMPKNRHWVLLAAYNEWNGAHGKNLLCFNISEKLGMPYTARTVPCEVVLNGDYIGLYFLTEQIRVDKNRVNITEQANLETDSTLITGGWLLELDNRNDDNQIKFRDKGTGRNLRISYHSPDELSEEQLNYLTNMMLKVNDCVNSSDYSSREWEEYIDIEALARFYVLLEAIDDQEGFSGSCWFSKERGENTKLVWGPYWDSGSALGNRNLDNPDFFYNDDYNSMRNYWIPNIVKFPRFQIAIRKYWEKYRDEVFPTMQTEVDAWGEMSEAALAQDYLRWGDETDMYPDYYRRKFMITLTNKLNFLASKWDTFGSNIKWTTYFGKTNLALPQGVRAFVVNSICEDGVAISPVEYIPANVGVLLFGVTEFDEFEAPLYNGPTHVYHSILVGATRDQVVHDGFILHKNQFVLAPTDTPIKSHRCYIPVTSDDTTPTLVKIGHNVAHGDVNNDGNVTAADVTALYDVLLNDDFTNTLYGDQNGDGTVTVSDITSIYTELLGGGGI